MTERINERIRTFYGLNNKLNPSSAEYKEGMAWRSKDARIDKNGLWSARPALVACTTPPGTLAAWGSGNHFKNLAVENTDKIITGLATTECVDVGPNDMLYGTTGSGAVTRQRAAGTKTKASVKPPRDNIIPAPDQCMILNIAAKASKTVPAIPENFIVFFICLYFVSTA